MFWYVLLFGLIGGLNFNYKLIKDRRFRFYINGWVIKTLAAMIIGFTNIMVREVPLDGFWLWTSASFVKWILGLWLFGLFLDFLFAGVDQDFEESMLRYVSGGPWFGWCVLFLGCVFLVEKTLVFKSDTILRDFKVMKSGKAIALNESNISFRACEIFPPRDDNILRITDKDAITRANTALADANLPGCEVRSLYLQLREGRLCFICPVRLREKNGERKDAGIMPGYVIVDASCRGRAIYVRHEISVFDPNDAFKRIYRSGGIRYAMHEACFNADPNGNAVWLSFLKRDSDKYLWIGMANGVMVLDAMTGETRHYSRDAMPAWLRVVLPRDVCAEWLRLYASAHGWKSCKELGTFTNGTDAFLAYEIAKGSRYDSLVAVNRRTGDMLVANELITAGSAEAGAMLETLGIIKTPCQLAESVCPVVLEETSASGNVAWQRLLWSVNLGGSNVAIVSSEVFNSHPYSISEYAEGLFDDFAQPAGKGVE